jgi:hypothetical protein
VKEIEEALIDTAKEVRQGCKGLTSRGKRGGVGEWIGIDRAVIRR